MDIVKTLLPSIVVGLVLFYWQRQQKRRDDNDDCRSAAQKEEAMLSLKLQRANAKMSYACAMALKNGKMNGELEKAIAAYNQADEQWNVFMNAQATEKLMGD
jgi:hypothetical protein